MKKNLKEEKKMFEIKEVSKVEATGNAFGMWASSTVAVGACFAGVKLLTVVLAC